MEKPDAGRQNACIGEDNSSSHQKIDQRQPDPEASRTGEKSAGEGIPVLAALDDEDVCAPPIDAFPDIECGAIGVDDDDVELGAPNDDDESYRHHAAATCATGAIGGAAITSAGAAAPTGGLVRLDQVTPTKVRWLLPKLIACGKVTLADGNPGEGKSLFTIDLAARCTTGRGLLDMPQLGPFSVLFVVCEDGIADTIVPRAVAAGADLSKLVVLQKVNVNGLVSLPELPRDVAHIERLVTEHGFGLIVIDPLTAYIGGRLDTFKDSDVRKVMTPLAELAEKTGAAILAVRHLNKKADQSAMYRGGGSIGFVGAARSALLIGQHPSAGDDDRVVTRFKTNVAKRETVALHFRIKDMAGVPAIEWVEHCQISADEVLAGRSDKQPEDGSRLATAIEFLRRELLGGAIRATDIYTKADKATISKPTLKRAADQLRVRRYEAMPEGGSKPHWWWALPMSEDS